MFAPDRGLPDAPNFDMPCRWRGSSTCTLNPFNERKYFDLSAILSRYMILVGNAEELESSRFTLDRKGER